ncbi:MAG: hypothetical protein AAB728_04180 [Patescibacteria group bacterium]
MLMIVCWAIVGAMATLGAFMALRDGNVVIYIAGFMILIACTALFVWQSWAKPSPAAALSFGLGVMIFLPMALFYSARRKTLPS